MKLEDFNVKELKKIVSKYNHLVAIKGYSKLKKVDLIKHLRNSKKIKITETEKGVKIVVVNTIMEEDKEVKEKKVKKKKEKKKEPKKEKPKPLTLKQQADLIEIIEEEEELEEPKKEKEIKADKFEFPKLKLKFKKDNPKIVITEEEEEEAVEQEHKADKFEFPIPPKISFKKLPTDIYDEYAKLRKNYEDGEEVFPTFTCKYEVSNFIYLQIIENNKNGCIYNDILQKEKDNLRIGGFNEITKEYVKYIIPKSNLIENMKKYNLTFDLPKNFKKIRKLPLQDLGKAEIENKYGFKYDKQIIGSYLGGFDLNFLEKDGFDMLYNNYIECAKNNKILCVPMTIGTGIGVNCKSTHRNMICINPFTKTFERYEPHGQTSYLGSKRLCYLSSEEYDIILKQIVDYWEKQYKLKLKYVPPNESCPKPKDLKLRQIQTKFKKYTEEEAKEILVKRYKTKLDNIKTKNFYDGDKKKQYSFVQIKDGVDGTYTKSIIGFAYNTDRVYNKDTKSFDKMKWIKEDDRRFTFYDETLKGKDYSKKQFIKIAIEHFKLKQPNSLITKDTTDNEIIYDIMENKLPIEDLSKTKDSNYLEDWNETFANKKGSINKTDLILLLQPYEYNFLSGRTDGNTGLNLIFNLLDKIWVKVKKNKKKKQLINNDKTYIELFKEHDDYLMGRRDLEHYRHETITQIADSKSEFKDFINKHYDKDFKGINIEDNLLEFYEGGDKINQNDLINVKPDGEYITYKGKVMGTEFKYFKKTNAKDKDHFYPIRESIKEFKELHEELGFQSLQGKEGRVSGEGDKTKIKIKTDASELSIKEVGGYCCMWSFFLMDLRLKFPKLTASTIFTKAYERLNKGKTPFLTFIRAYTHKFMEEMEKEIGGGYELIETKFDDTKESKDIEIMKNLLNEKLVKKLENYRTKIETH